MGQMGWGGEFGWMRFAGERFRPGGHDYLRGATATHDRRVARRVMRRIGARWLRVSRQVSARGHCRRLYWFDDEALVRLPPSGRG